MYDKWNLNRFPFYTRPIDRSNMIDFSGREKELQELQLVLKSREGVVAVIGERGVGTTSITNYCRFSQQDCYTFKFEIRVENYADAHAILEAIVYSIASDLRNRKIKCKATGAFLEEYNINNQFLDLKAGFEGIGMSVGRKSKLKNIFPVLIEIFTNLVNEITSKKAFNCCIFQLNNFDVNIDNRDKIIEILNVFRDIFHTPKTIWYLLGDTAMETLINENISRLSSIIRHWVYVSTIPSNEFLSLFKKRIENSGENALCPFTDEAIVALAEATMGRPRFALDIAGKLIEKFSDIPYPEILDKKIIEDFAHDEIRKIAEVGSLSKTSINILKAVAKHPGKNATVIARYSSVNPGNLLKYALPLAKKKLIRIEKSGRSTVFYPCGLGTLLF